MTVPATDSRAGPFFGTGVIVPLPFDFKVFAQEDVLVTRTDVDGIESTLAIGVDYTVTLNPDQDADPGGVVTPIVAPTTGELTTLTSGLDFEQPIDLVTGGKFRAQTVEDGFDRTTMLIKQLKEQSDRTLHLPVSAEADVTLPVPEAHALIGWNETADALQNVDPTTLATIVAFGTATADIFSGDGVTTDFTLSANPGAQANLHGSIGTADQRPGIDFTWAGGTTVHFITPPPPGTDNILFQYMQGLPQGTSDSASSSYSAGGVGSVLRSTQGRLRETISPLDFDAAGDGVTDDTAAVLATLADGREVDLLSLPYAVNATIPITGTVYAAGAVLKFTGNVTSALELQPGANLIGKLTVDVSTVNCTNGVLCNGALQATHDTAQRCDTIYVKGQNHTASTNGLMLDSTTAGAANKAWLHYMKLRRIIVENFNTGVAMLASQATLTLSYVNANVIDELTVIGCKRSIVMDAASNSDVSSNFIQRYICQYGAVAGSFPTDGIKLTGRCGYNRIEGFIYDWDHANTTGPVVSFDATTFDNFITSSAYSWEVSDLGLRNRHVSATSPAQTNIWASAFGRGFLGSQDNTLAHWQPSVGTLTSAASSTGTASCSLTAGALLDVQRENHSFASVGFVAGTGVASFAIEFRSTTNLVNNLAVVGAYFEPGYLPHEVTVQVDTGSGYVTRADIADIHNPEVFCRLDSVGGTDICQNVIGVKFILKGNDTRTVRLRQVYANGSLFKPSVSRGGDRMVGDLRWPNGVGPVLVSPDGTEWRVTINNAGSLVMVNSPTKVMTFF